MTEKPRKLILPGSGYDPDREVEQDDPERALAIAGEIDKRTFGREPVSVCTVPTGDGNLCLHPFFEGDSERDRLSHLRACTARHEQEIRDEHDRLHPPGLQPWDTEFKEWVDLHRDSILAGRTTAF